MYLLISNFFSVWSVCRVVPSAIHSCRNHSIVFTNWQRVQHILHGRCDDSSLWYYYREYSSWGSQSLSSRCTRNSAGSSTLVEGMSHSNLIYSAHNFQTNKLKYPILARIAQDYLAAIPAASMASERLFSSEGQIVSPQRGSLSPHTIEHLQMLKSAYKNGDAQ